jgi:hypothetical protein
MAATDSSPPEQPADSSTERPASDESESPWQSRSGLDFRQAEELLDWLERCGCTCREVVRSEDGQSLTVRWRA